jgi:TonB family protein
LSSSFKYLIIFLFICILTDLFGQDSFKMFFDYDRKSVDSSSAKFYSVYRERSDTIVKSGTIETYFINGILLKRIDYFYEQNDNRREKIIYYYDNGIIESITNCLVLDLDGEQFSYFPNGKLKRKAVYKNNKRLQGNCYTVDGTDTTYYETADRMPTFPGGRLAMEKFLYNDLTYPPDAKDKRISGTVEIEVIIGKFGDIEKISVAKSLYPSLDNEALRLVKKLPKWTPGFYKDDLLKKYEKIQISFDLK